MGTLALSQVSKAFGTMQVLHAVNLDVQDGEFVARVGPSDCGKSTLLRMIAGLESVTGGEIRLDGKLMNEVAPKDRNVAMVFQSYALYPHMSVRDNMGFSLKMAGMRKGPSDRSGQPRRRYSGPCPLYGPQAQGTVRRPDAARRDGPRHRAQPRDFPVRRTPVQP